jgi:hypothetical protein
VTYKFIDSTETSETGADNGNIVVMSSQRTSSQADHSSKVHVGDISFVVSLIRLRGLA